MSTKNKYRLLEYMSHIENDSTIDKALKEELLQNGVNARIYSSPEDMFADLDDFVAEIEAKEKENQ